MLTGKDLKNITDAVKASNPPGNSAMNERNLTEPNKGNNTGNSTGIGQIPSGLITQPIIVNQPPQFSPWPQQQPQNFSENRGNNNNNPWKNNSKPINNMKGPAPKPPQQRWEGPPRNQGVQGREGGDRRPAWPRRETGNNNSRPQTGSRYTDMRVSRTGPGLQAGQQRESRDQRGETRFKSTWVGNQQGREYERAASVPPLMSRTPTIRCYSCGETGHMQRECPRDIVCYACGKSGHMLSQCPTHHFIERVNPIPQSQQSVFDPTKRCFACRTDGHLVAQ